MWVYEQSSGQLTHDDTLVGTGYAGHGSGVDNPAMQTVPEVGPLPQGMYTIGDPVDDPHTGPMSMHLVPDAENQMFGRGAFLIHGDNAACNHTASEGCVIMPHDVRVLIANSNDKRLEVIA